MCRIVLTSCGNATHIPLPAPLLSLPLSLVLLPLSSLRPGHRTSRSRSTPSPCWRATRGEPDACCFWGIRANKGFISSRVPCPFFFPKASCLRKMCTLVSATARAWLGHDVDMAGRGSNMDQTWIKHGLGTAHARVAAPATLATVVPLTLLTTPLFRYSSPRHVAPDLAESDDGSVDDAVLSIEDDGCGLHPADCHGLFPNGAFECSPVGKWRTRAAFCRYPLA